MHNVTYSLGKRTKGNQENNRRSLASVVNGLESLEMLAPGRYVASKGRSWSRRTGKGYPRNRRLVPHHAALNFGPLEFIQKTNPVKPHKLFPCENVGSFLHTTSYPLYKMRITNLHLAFGRRADEPTRRCYA